MRTVAMVLAMVVASATAQAEPAVSLYAAGSLTGALGETAKAYGAATGIEVATNFGPSGQMRERIEAGEPATVFASADFGHPKKLAEAGKAGPVVVFARNRLCAMARPGLAVTQRPRSRGDARPRGQARHLDPRQRPVRRLCLGRVRQGRSDAARRGGGARGQGAETRRRQGQRQAARGRNTYAWHLADGRADLFLGYCSAGKVAAGELPGLTVVDLPDGLAVGADYGLTVLKGPADQEAAAARFAMFILSPAGQAILARWGFTPVAAPAG